MCFWIAIFPYVIFFEYPIYSCHNAEIFLGLIESNFIGVIFCNYLGKFLQNYVS